jgi:hypothetical protein
MSAAFTLNNLEHCITYREDNIKMNLGEIGCICMDWIHLAQEREQCRALINSVMNLRVP